MKIVLFCHPPFLNSQSMPRFAQMLTAAYRAHGHPVDVWSPKARAFNWLPRGRFSKWAGYFDQYVLFPMWVRAALKKVSPDTLFVFCDQALGPWVPLVKHRPHVVHVHDLLALRSAMGDVEENRTSVTGRIYQRYIRHGFRQAHHFISISKKTRDDLHRFGGIKATTSEVVYNGLNYPYAEVADAAARDILRAAGLPTPATGMLLHVGGGQWYKNLLGIVSLYAEYATREGNALPLWCIGPPPNAAVRTALAKVPANGAVMFFRNLNDATLQAIYSQARVLLFPSLAEGFGWPLIEAQACGCPVITTDAPPMNEVAGDAAVLLPKLMSMAHMETWAPQAATVLQELLAENDERRHLRKQSGLLWAQKFTADKAIDAYLGIYRHILSVPRDSGAKRPTLSRSSLI